jgi:hypothetical protein
MKITDSRGARFLTEMLDAFDGADFPRMMDVANDWQDTFWPFLWWREGNPEVSEKDRQALGEMVRELKRLFGHGLSAEKVSVTPNWQMERIQRLWQNCLESLAPETRNSLGSVLEMADLGAVESLDSRYSHVLEVLQKIIARVGTLDKLPPLTTPNRSVRLAFEEAHQCYLYGFPRACAALCRTTLEAALREALRTVREKNITDETDFCKLLGFQSAKNLLGELHGFAHEVRIAGNYAVHHADTFEDRYPPDKLQEIVGKARMLIEHLYALPAA